MMQNIAPEIQKLKIMLQNNTQCSLKFIPLLRKHRVK